MKLILNREWRAFRVGEIIDVDPDTGDWLLNSGAATDPKKVAVPNSSPSNILENLETEEEKPEPEVAKPEPPVKVERPKKSARIDAWREYAESKKIITKGFSKAQIIAAVEKVEN